MLRDNNNFLEKKDFFEQGMLALHFDRPLEAIKYLLLLEEIEILKYQRIIIQNY